MPIEPRTWSSLPSILNGFSKDSVMRSASATGSRSLRMSSMRSANSSPPRRATVSSARAQMRRRSAAAIRSWSPAAWPRLSFTSLKPSRSRKSTATSRLPRRWRTLWTRSLKSARFARPDEPVRVVAEDALDRVALVEDRPVEVDHGDDVGAVLHERVEALLAGPELGGALADARLEVPREAEVLADREHLPRDDRDDQ